MLSPVIIVGCGGSGIKSVRYIREAVKARLAVSGWYEPLPDAWQFIGVDSVQGQSDLAEVPALPAQDYIEINGNFARVKPMYETLRAKYPKTSAGYKELAGWLPDSTEVQGDPRIGMGQLRGVGRAFGVYSLNTNVFKSRIQAAYTACQGGSAQLLDVCTRLEIAPGLGANVPPPLVIVIGSSAGGTGAGVMLDVIDVLKAQAPEDVNVVATVFGPEIFGAKMEAPMVANSLAFMSEMVNAYWANTPGAGGLFPAAGVAVEDRGPFGIFYVGRENMEGTDLQNSTTVYRAVGDTIASWVTSPRLSTDLREYVISNKIAPIYQGGYGFGRGHLGGAISSFGSATIAVGRTRFKSYAKAYLMRNLYEFHYQGAEKILADRVLSAGASSRPLRIIHENLANHYFPKYLQASGLKQVFDKDSRALEGISENILSRSDSEKVGRDFERTLFGRLPASEHDAAGWRTHVSTFATLLRKDALDKANLEFEARLNAWASRLAQKVLIETNLLIAEASLPVAIKVLEKTISELALYAAQYRQASEKAKGSVTTTTTDMWNRVNSISGSPRKESEGVKGACQLAGIGVAQDARSEGMKRLERVIGDIERNLLARLRSAMQMAFDGDVKFANLGTDDEPAIVSKWPRLEEVPGPFLPTAVEFLLEGPDAWPSNLKKLVRECVIQETSDLDEFEAFRREVTLGDTEDFSQQPPLLWNKEGGAVEWSFHQPFQASMSMTPADIDGSITHWMNTRTAMANFLKEGLSEYLEDEGQVARLQDFKTKFRSALRQSKPLIQIDQNRLVIDKANAGLPAEPVGVTPEIDPLPFNEGHPARQIAEELLRAELALNAGENLGRYFQNGRKDAAVMGSFLAGSVHPALVKNFTVTLANTMTGVSNVAALRGWMKFKRGRTLSEFVPVPVPLLQAMVRGFIVARILGHITIDTSQAVKISSEKKTFAFPFPLLSPVADQDVLAGLLESMSLCFSEFPSKGFDAFDAYKALYFYGVTSEQSDRPEQFSVIGSLADFLKTGTDNEEVLDGTTRTRFEAVTEDERKEKIVSYLDSFIDFYKKEQSEPSFTGEEMKNARGEVTPANTPTKELIDVLVSQFEVVRDTISAFGSAKPVGMAPSL